MSAPCRVGDPFASYPKNHPIRRRDPADVKWDDPEWKRIWGGPDEYNPVRLPLAPESTDLSHDEIKQIEAADAKVASDISTTSSQFWDGQNGSTSSQSSNGDNAIDQQFASLGKAAEAGDFAHTGQVAKVEATAAEGSQSQTLSDSPDLAAIRFSNAKMHPKKTGFMDLPGEVRNIVYEYAFPTGSDYEIIWLSKGKDLTHYRHRTPIQHKPKDVIFGKLRPSDVGFGGNFQVALKDREQTITRRKEARVQLNKKLSAYAHEVRTINSSKAKGDQKDANSLGPKKARKLNAVYPWVLQAKGFKALLCTNRQIHDEAGSLLYSRSSFSFASRALMKRFLDNLTPIARVNLCKIYLVHDMQNVPFKRADLTYSQKEREKLVVDLKALIAGCKSLTEFHLLVNIRGSYLRLALSESWASDLVNGLAGLKDLKDLKTFELNLILGDDTTNVRAVSAIRPRDDCKIQRSTQLVDAADQVRREILTDTRLKAFDQAKGKKKMKVLRIIG